MKPPVPPCMTATLVAGALIAGTCPARAAGADEEHLRPAVQNDRTTSRDVERFRLGALGGLGFPRPLAIEGVAKIDDLFAVGAEYSALPATAVSGVQTTLSSVAGDVRFFPLRGAFFVGAKLGEQHLGASASVAVPRMGTLHETLAYSEWFVNPRIGFLWTWSPGFTLGMDVGVQLPISSAMSTSLPPSALAYASSIPGVASAKNAVQWLGTGTLPTIDLIQLGMLF